MSVFKYYLSFSYYRDENSLELAVRYFVFNIPRAIDRSYGWR